MSGFNLPNWGSINSPGDSVVTGIIWSPYNASQTGGSDQGAQINLGYSMDAGVSLVSTDQTKTLNEDGTVAYFVTLTYNSAGNVDNIEFGLQGGGF